MKPKHGNMKRRRMETAMHFERPMILYIALALGYVHTCVADGRVSAPRDLPNPMVPGTTRSHRFPSREERLKLYLSNWYVPPCDNYEDGKIHYYVHKENVTGFPLMKVYERKDFNATLVIDLESVIEPDKLFMVDVPTLQTCTDYSDEEDEDSWNSTRVIFPHNMRMYCHDVAETVLPANTAVSWNLQFDQAVPLIFQFGDLKHSHKFGMINVPHFKKFRSATTPEGLSASTVGSCHDKPRPPLETSHSRTHFQPIIWKLATHRHFRLAHKVYREDTNWARKKNVAVFRGQLTGAEFYDRTEDYVTNCHRIIRCRLVYEHANSKIVSARLTSTRDRFPAILEGRKLLGKKVSMRQLLQCKALIMIEGNDVASGLKWALLSQSVVLMPIPTHTSWAMEELLEPWVHYVPLEANLTDVKVKMQWVLDHDNEARAIAQRASLWMEDLVFHPDAQEDDVWVQQEMIRRYQSHFQLL